MFGRERHEVIDILKVSLLLLSEVTENCKVQNNGMIRNLGESRLELDIKHLDWI